MFFFSIRSRFWTLIKESSSFSLGLQLPFLANGKRAARFRPTEPARLSNEGQRNYMFASKTSCNKWWLVVTISPRGAPSKEPGYEVGLWAAQWTLYRRLYIEFTGQWRCSQDARGPKLRTDGLDRQYVRNIVWDNIPLTTGDRLEKLQNCAAHVTCQSYEVKSSKWDPVILQQLGHCLSLPFCLSVFACQSACLSFYLSFYCLSVFLCVFLSFFLFFIQNLKNT